MDNSQSVVVDSQRGTVVFRIQGEETIDRVAEQRDQMENVELAELSAHNYGHWQSLALHEIIRE